MDVHDVHRALSAIIREFPDRRNPGEGNCVYTDGGGRHCLVGELAARAGWSLPPVDSGENGVSVVTVALELEWPVDDAAVDYLASVQVRADIFRPGNHVSPRWGDIVLPDPDGWDPESAA